MMGTNSEDLDLKNRKILSIFLSYGHKDSGKVDLIKKGLAARGYENLWIDVEQLKPGAVWRRDIVEGIEKSNIFIAFLSKESMKAQGVCRDEIKISIGLKGNNIKGVLLQPKDNFLPPLPATIMHSQLLDISQWDGDKKTLKQYLDQICAMVASQNNLYFDGEIDHLREIMNPIDCEGRKQQLYSHQMFGREWLYDALDKWDESNLSNVFWLSGGAGFGKSLFAANLCFEKPQKVAAAHFVESNSARKNEAGNILKNLAFQLARRYSDYCKFIVDLPAATKHKLFDEDCSPDDLCDILFCEKANLCINGERESTWVLIDALDEATIKGRNHIARMIAQYRDRFPPWLKFIITSRNDPAVITALSSMKPDVYSLDEKIKQYQRQDMRAFLKATLAERHFSDDVFDILVEKSEGMFLYLRFVCEKILTEKLEAWQVKDLPQGIKEYYDSCFNRYFGIDPNGNDEKFQVYNDKVRPILAICSAAYEILPLRFFAEIMRCSEDDIRKSIAMLGTLKTDRKENGNESFQLCHKSVWDWLVDKDNFFYVSKEDGLKKLTDFCLNKIKDYKMEQIVRDPNCEYPLRYVIRHLVEEKNEQAIWELLGGTDPQLPKLQFDYFESYAASVSSLKTAILFYLDLYNTGSGKAAGILPKIARLMITYTHLLSEQQKDLQKIFQQGNSLQTTLDFMDSIKDVKVYFIIGCYLLTKAGDNHWDMDRLISAIEEKCANQIDSISGAVEDFLGLGVLPQVAKDMSAEQMIRLLKNIETRWNAKNVVDSVKDQLNLPQTARASWYFDKLQDSECGRLGDFAKLSEEKDRIGKIQDAGDRCKELIKLATGLYVHDDLPEAERLLGEVIDLFKVGEGISKYRVREAAELYWNMGKTTEAGRLILDHHEIYGTRSEDDFINDLCKFGLSKEACGFFEKFILPNPEEATDFLKKCVSPILFLKAMIENGQSGKIKDLPDGIDIGTSDLIDLLETMIRCGAMNEAAENLKKFCSPEENQDDFFAHPKLLVLMRKLKEAGAWTEEIPEEKELKARYLQNHTLEKIEDFRGVLSADFSLEFQVELIQEGWQCFLETMKKPELSGKKKADIANDMGLLLAQNSSTMRSKLAPIVSQYLDKIKELSIDNEFFYNLQRVRSWMNGSDTLLNDTLDKAAVDAFAAWCEQKIMEIIQNGNYDRDVECYAQALLRYYFTDGQRSKAEALLNILPKSDPEKMGFAFDTLRGILYDRRRRSERENLPLPAIPEDFTTGVDLVCSFCSPQNMKLRDIKWEVSNFLEELKPYREQPEALRIGEQIWKMLDPVFRKTPFNDLRYSFALLKEGGSWCIPEEQFGRWFGKITDYVTKEDGRWNHRDDHAEVMIRRFLDSEHLPENWYGDILDDIAKITDLSDKNKLLTKLLAVVIRKGTPEQQQGLLARLTDSALIGNSRELRDLDMEALYRVLTGGNVSDTGISCVVKNMNWEDLPFGKLCLIAPHMLDEKDYLEKWFDRLFRKLQEEKNLKTMREIAAECPELGLADFCGDPAAPAAAAPLTVEQVAGMVPKKSDAVLALRRQLAEEEITPKGYRKMLGELLAALPEETKQKVADLERSLEEGDITEKGFARQLGGLLD